MAYFLQPWHLGPGSWLICSSFISGEFSIMLQLSAFLTAGLCRGRAMGVFTVLMTNGAHFAPILGGLLGQFLGWRCKSYTLNFFISGS
jgi:predicted MFS family arabinose efflux permease